MRRASDRGCAAHGKAIILSLYKWSGVGALMECFITGCESGPVGVAGTGATAGEAGRTLWTGQHSTSLSGRELTDIHQPEQESLFYYLIVVNSREWL